MGGKAGYLGGSRLVMCSIVSPEERNDTANVKAALQATLLEEDVQEVEAACSLKRFISDLGAPDWGCSRT